MKWWQFLTVLGASLFSFADPLTATATTYSSQSGNTTVVLSEKTETPSGYYFTTTRGRDWLGSIYISQVQDGVNSRSYRGTFQDFTLGPDTQRTCEGNISITRRSIPRNAQLQIDVVWQVTAGEACDSIGETYSLNLVEPLPRPDRNGDFAASNANTWQSETAGEATWPLWRVVSSDGELNCRTSPNGAIQSVYDADTEQVRVEGRAVDAIVTDDAGRPWIWTNRGCYVRANSQYVEPVSLPW